jgi:hypothetical protein
MPPPRKDQTLPVEGECVEALAGLFIHDESEPEDEQRGQRQWGSLPGLAGMK